MLTSTYDGVLVVFSLLVAFMASYTALDLSARISSAKGSAAHWWLCGGAFAMGTGVWSMHFIGMLAFDLPIPLGYDPLITAGSLLLAMASSGFALWLASGRTLPWSRLAGGAILMGAGIAGMHYSGMAAMRMSPAIQYDPLGLGLSILIAIVASGAALWIAFHLRRATPRVRLRRAGAAVVMGIAITGMHYTGMAAADFPLGSICGAVNKGIDTGWLAWVVISISMSVLAIALITSVLDMRMEARTDALAASLEQANRELTHLALHDMLTKLPNRLLLEDRLDHEIAVDRASASGFAVMYMDLDGFKTVNDAYGHHIGDQLLVEIAERIRATLRPQDTVARVGGDEFVILTSIATPAEAASLAQKLLLAIQEPVKAGGRQLHVSTSIGIAMYPSDADHKDDLLAFADAAMYHAKSSGRNTYCFFEASMNANVHEELQLAQDLRLAIERNELVLQYQPKFTAPDGPIVGVEALVRWSHPVMGMLGPDRFIPLSEKTGLIVAIGEWVLNEACRQMSEWHKAGWQDLTMSVNLSALQFAHANLAHTVRDALKRHAIKPQCLTLEVTESTAMRDADESLRILQQLRDMGVQISIDDFGTGYSSLLYLKRLPASELKIDRGFIRDLVRDSEDAAIVSAIVALGRTLNLTIVAEGVETEAQQEFLTRVGCDSLQGFLLGRPMSAENVIAALGRTNARIENP